MGRVGSEMFRASADCRDANRSGAAMADASGVENAIRASLWWCIDASTSGMLQRSDSDDRRSASLRHDLANARSQRV
jgi:hypothetical protein